MVNIDLVEEGSVMSNTATKNENITPREVTQADLPLHCPMPNDTLWDAHPRVVLDVEKTGEVACPYCGAKYFLK